jgi:hypothetical protein
MIMAETGTFTLSFALAGVLLAAGAGMALVLRFVTAPERSLATSPSR